MSDIFTREKRSEIMSRVKGGDTKPEITVRKLLHKMGYRFRLHVGRLPGKPDIVLPRHKKVIHIHGCFWHGHPNCRRAKLPATNEDFWREKIAANVSRDKRNIAELNELGWQSLVVWSCEIRKREVLEEKIKQFMAPTQGCRE